MYYVGMTISKQQLTEVAFFFLKTGPDRSSTRHYAAPQMQYVVSRTQHLSDHVITHVIGGMYIRWRPVFH